ncbi:MAG: hypothetical protein IPJ87_04210 [Flavobacteriales bacterium]|jgi:hypothetical protein|nr:hypothetical protein [Flavobacteriales bacterium]
MMRRSLLALLVAATTPLAAQDVTAFLDYRDRLVVFDKGTFSVVEGVRPAAFQVGGNYVSYLNAIGDLKRHANGRTTTLDRSTGAQITVTDHLLGVKLATALKLHDGRELRTVCVNTGLYVVEDSLAAWVDEAQRTIHIWYNGRDEVLADGLAIGAVQDWKSGDNLLAWVSTIERRFRIFHRGVVYDAADVYDAGIDFQAGADLVLYLDPQGNGLKAFHKGNFYDLEPIAPQRYAVGKGIGAWLDRTGALKVLEDGQIYTATDFAPTEFHVRDSLVVFRDQDMLKVFQAGRVHEVERYWPERWDASWGMLAYTAVDGTVRVWRKGRGEVALRERTATGFSLQRGLLTVTMPLNAVRIWWKGRVYTQ